ncbi:MAG: hypothetical protein ACJASQ_000354 [Crocinitomicaceae bacterium]|jgi:hypothetical protein
MAMSLEYTGVELGVDTMLPVWNAQEEISSKILSDNSVFMSVFESIIMPVRLAFESFVSHFLDRL